MAESDRSRTEEDATKQRASRMSDAAPTKPDAGEHRLRGGELEKDFVDAEGDSCVVHKHRTDAESDS